MCLLSLTILLVRVTGLVGAFRMPKVNNFNEVWHSQYINSVGTNGCSNEAVGKETNMPACHAKACSKLHPMLRILVGGGYIICPAPANSLHEQSNLSNSSFFLKCPAIFFSSLKCPSSFLLKIMNKSALITLSGREFQNITIYHFIKFFSHISSSSSANHLKFMIHNPSTNKMLFSLFTL